jgi:hypothetical protein
MVHGASGGVRTLAVQFAKLRGARVFANASGADGVKLVRNLGADVAIDAHQEDVFANSRRECKRSASLSRAAKNYSPNDCGVSGQSALRSSTYSKAQLHPKQIDAITWHLQPRPIASVVPAPGTLGSTSTTENTRMSLLCRATIW